MTSNRKLVAAFLVVELLSLISLKAAFERARADYKEARRG